jgi:predicted RNase H-like HicB family nuclease
MIGEAHKGEPMNFRIEFEREEDGRWITEIPELPGVICYGPTKQDAESQAKALAIRVIAEQMARASTKL